jgi:hypothetical protein
VITFSVLKPTWCTFHSIYWESTASTCLEHYLLILMRCYTNSSLYIACVSCQLAVARLQCNCNPDTTDLTRTKYINCHLCRASWWWTSNARNKWRLLILNILNKKCITLVTLSWYTMMHSQQNIKGLLC